jgi:hypothetical protein
VSPCIEATGSNLLGYRISTIVVGGKQWNILQHRMAWEMANGQTIPAGMVVMHACDHRPCINPEHLRLGTPAENTEDMRLKGRARNGNAYKTVCKNGHPFDGWLPSSGRRYCKTCRRAWTNARRAQSITEQRA